MNRTKKNNFVSDISGYYKWHIIRDLDSKISSTINFYNKAAQDFDFTMINISELRYLIEIFKNDTLNCDDTSKHLSLEKVLENVNESIRQEYIATIYFQSFNEHIELNFFESKDTSGYDIDAMTENISRIYSGIEHSVICLKNIFSILHKLKLNYKNDEIQNLQYFVEIFHECDMILTRNLKMYSELKGYPFMWWAAINQYESDYKMNSQDIIQKRIKEIFSEFVEKYDLKWNLNIENFGFNYKKPFFQLIFSAKRITYWLINHKINIMDTIIKKQSKYRISNKLFNNCYNYFHRFYKLSILRNELINDHSVDTAVDAPGNFLTESLKSVLPLYLIEIHKAIEARKQMIGQDLVADGTFE